MDAIFQTTFSRAFSSMTITLIKFSLKYVCKGPIDNNPALVQIMAWRRSGDKPLSEPMIVTLLTHICVTRPQWVEFTYLYDERPIFWTCRKHLLAIDLISRKLGSMIHRGVAELGSVPTTQHTEGKFTHIHHRSHDMSKKATGSGPNGLHFIVFCATSILHFWFILFDVCCQIFLICFQMR